MSDPVTNIEIEDVLSSIRRLVSEGEKAKHVVPAPEKPENTQPERLVLTPALRVKTDDSPRLPDPEPQAEPESDGDLPDDQPEVVFDRERLEQSDIPFDRASLEATIAELEAAVTEQPDEWEPDGSEVVTDTALDPSWARAGFASDQPVEDAVEVAETPEDAEPDQWNGVPDTAQAQVGDTEPTPSAPFVLEQTLSQAPEDDAVDTAAPAPTPETSADIATSAAWIPGAPEVVMREFVHRTATESVVDALADHIAAEADTKDTAVASEHDSLPPISFRRDAEPEADEDFGDDLRAPDPDAPDDPLETFLADDTIVDEAALRQIVLEIVREELQGKLGERITKNVRKLVRREIHRVLSSQDFD